MQPKKALGTESATAACRGAGPWNSLLRRLAWPITTRRIFAGGRTTTERPQRKDPHWLRRDHGGAVERFADCAAATVFVTDHRAGVQPFGMSRPFVSASSGHHALRAAKFVRMGCALAVKSSCRTPPTQICAIGAKVSVPRVCLLSPRAAIRSGRRITVLSPISAVPTSNSGKVSKRQVSGNRQAKPNVSSWVGSRPAAFAETPPNSRQAVFHQNANLPLPEDRQVVAPCPSRQVLADRHDLDLDRIRDLLPVLVTGPSRQPIPSG